MGLGPDFYAPAATRLADGRYLLFGWIPEDPPEEGSKRSWAGSLTLPRVVTLGPDGFVEISLAAEVWRFEGRCERLRDRRLDRGRTWTRALREPYVEWRASIDPGSAASVRIDITGPTGLEAELRYDRADRRLTVSRMGRVGVAGRDPHGSVVLPRCRRGEAIEFRVIIDGSVIELVANDVVTGTVRRPDVPGACRLTVTALGGSIEMHDVELTRF